MTERTIDLDALAAELRAAGYRAERNELGIKVMTGDGHKIGWVIGSSIDEWSGNEWTAIDIIRGAVSSSAPRVKMTDEMWAAFSAAKEAYSHSNNAETDVCEALDRMMAMLEGTA